MPSYIQKRANRFYAVMEIPKALRSHFAGKPRFLKSLDTDSLTVARRRVGPIVATWLADLERAKGGPVELDAAFFRKALREAGPAEGRDADGHPTERRTLILDMLHDRAGEIDLGGNRSEAERFYGEATTVGTADYLDEFLAAEPVSPHTKATHKTDLLRLAARFPLLHQVRRAAVKRWAMELVEQGLSPMTVRRIMAPMRSFWRHLQSLEVVSEELEPFDGLSIGRQSKRDTQRAARRPFEAADVPRLWRAAAELRDPALSDLIMLAAYSGARIGELCLLQTADVDLVAGSISIRFSKTGAGVRQVPAHEALRPILTRLSAASDDGFILSNQAAGKFGERTNALSKRFGKLRTAMGFDRGVTFHSLRRSFITALERAGVPEGTVQDIVGHERSTLTGSTYSGKSTFEMKRAAIEKLAYP